MILSLMRPLLLFTSISASFASLIIPSLMNNDLFNITQDEISLSNELSDMQLLEGDIIPTYTAIAQHYGNDVAKEMGLESPSDQKSRGASPYWSGWKAEWKAWWDMPVIKIHISTAFNHDEQKLITTAVNKLRNRAGVFWTKFLDDRPTDGTPYISINAMYSGGCGASYIGLYKKLATSANGQPLYIRKDSRCITVGSIQHELFHTLGFFHEQSRPDRDDYIKIHWTNIEDNYHHNFNKATEDINSLGVEYDYNSILHYHSKAFSKDPYSKDTITAGDKTDQLGKAEKASSLDILQLRLLYQCRRGVRTQAEFYKNTCTEGCKCGLNFKGCGSDDGLCKNPFVCKKNKCVWPHR